MDNPHVMSKFATVAECHAAREKWYQDRIKGLEKAVEFAEYMATAAERFQGSCNALYEATESEDEQAIERAQESHTDHFRGLTSNIYEFRKRIPK